MDQERDDQKSPGKDELPCYQSDDDSLRLVQNDEQLESSNDTWASAEGYTPFLSNSQSPFIFTDGLSSFVASSIVHVEEREEDDDDDFRALDYLSVAEKALDSLEEDYKRTLSLSLSTVPEQSTVHPEPPTEPSTSQLAFDAEFSHIDSALPQHQHQPHRINEVDKPYPHKEQPVIDTVSVKHAIQSIESKNPKLVLNFKNWEQNQKLLLFHELIPSRPLAAFRKQSAKAIKATGRLSRSATIADALRRLDILHNYSAKSRVRRIHVVGCDRVECDDPTKVRLMFGPVARWIGEYHESPEELEFHLIGPNVPIEATQWGTIYLLPENDATATKTRRLQSAIAVCHNCLYEKFITDNPTTPPDMAIAFNAGVWGYQEWKTTLKSLMTNQNENLAFVFTAYT
jgi:hypothetical protein